MFCFRILCIGCDCALKWLDVDFCNGSFALYDAQPLNNVTLNVVTFLFPSYYNITAEKSYLLQSVTDEQH